METEDGGLARRSNTHAKKKEPKTPTVAFLLSNFRLFILKATQLYLRHPLKLFKPISYDALFYLRMIDKYNSGVNKNKRYSKNTIINNIITNNSLCVVFRAARKNGFSTLYDKVLPPLVANSISGTILFTTYLTLNKMNCDLPFFNGFASGIVNNFVNTPLQNFYVNKIINNQAEVIDLHKNNGSLIKYIISNFDKDSARSRSAHGNKRHVMLLAYAREGLAYATYFSLFERLNKKERGVWNTLSAGLLATVSLQLIKHPLSKLESIMHNFEVSSYRDVRRSINELKLLEKKSTLAILYQGFFRNTLSYLPSMTTTLILLDYLREITNN